MSGFKGNICACRAHCDTDIRLRQCGCVIYAVAYHCNRMPFGLILLHNFNLIFGQEVGAILNTKFFGKRGGGTLIVTCEQFNMLDTESAQFGERSRDFRTQRVGGGEDCRKFSVAGDK